MPHSSPAKRRKYLRRWHRLNPNKQREYDKRRAPGYWRGMKSRYGVTQAVYEAMRKAQRNRCAICKCRETALGRGGKVRPLAVDHNHSTGTVRGLLCLRCNAGLGNAKEDAAILRSMISYLEKT